MKKNKLFLYLAVLITWITCSMWQEVHGEIIHVTTTQDQVTGSLRAAITTANSNSESDTIYLPAGSYRLTGAAGEDSNAGGDLDIDSPHKITIIGDGLDSTIIDANQSDRVLDIIRGTVSITGVTFRGGKTPDADLLQDSDVGGGIKNAGTLELIRCSVCDNTTGNGGRCPWGKYGARARNSGDGGGIYNSGSLSLNTCIIKNNSTGPGGAAGINQWGGRSGYGGGIFNFEYGSITLTKCTISHNRVGIGGQACGGGDGGNGGGIFNSENGEIKCFKSTISDNSAGDGGEALGAMDGGNGGGGGGICNFNYISLTNCTISNNRTGAGGISDGGPTGYSGSGGGIFNWHNADFLLTNCTVTGNYIGECFEPGHGGDGGGIWNNEVGFVYLTNTIVANNEVFYYDGDGPDGFGDLESHGYNLIEDSSSCNISGTLTGNIYGQDPLLGPLADNGGPTLTHALFPGSPAIDAGSSSGLSDDQRGFPRPIDVPTIPNAKDGSDIGAYEVYISYLISGSVKYWDGETVLAGITLTFSNNGGSTTTNDSGFYSLSVPLGWSGTVIPSKTGYKFYPQSRSYSSITAEQKNQDYLAEPTTSPQISLNRAYLDFGADNGSYPSASQSFFIANSGGGILFWEVGDDVSWLNCTPASGQNAGSVTASVDASGLAAGSYSGTITVSAPGAQNSPQLINVSLTVYNAYSSGVPFGFFETPSDGAYVFSSIPVTGWALDDIGVDSVKIYREEGTILAYIGDAVFIEGARPDVELAYPNYPQSYKAGWGYMMLTNFLPGGNGRFTLHAVATDKEGHQVTLGVKTIDVDNAHAVKPFGAIDIPAQGGVASGTGYRNQGWVLTPPPNKIPEDGHTITVWIDGIGLGNPVYNLFRPDIAALFPGYANSNGSLAYFDFNTAGYANGIHTIMWTAVDSAGNADGIGSRYFSIQNPAGGTEKGKGNEANTSRVIKSFDQTFSKVWPPAGPPEAAFQYVVADYSTLCVQKGYNPKSSPDTFYQDENGQYIMEIKELERIVIYLDEPGKNTPSDPYVGYLMNGDKLKPLPIGSTLDGVRGVFYWQPGPGFIGTYRLVFIKEDKTGTLKKQELSIKIIPKF